MNSHNLSKMDGFSPIKTLVASVILSLPGTQMTVCDKQGLPVLDCTALPETGLEFNP